LICLYEPHTYALPFFRRAHKPAARNADSDDDSDDDDDDAAEPEDAASDGGLP